MSDPFAWMGWGTLMLIQVSVTVGLAVSVRYDLNQADNNLISPQRGRNYLFRAAIISFFLGLSLWGVSKRLDQAPWVIPAVSSECEVDEVLPSTQSTSKESSPESQKNPSQTTLQGPLQTPPTNSSSQSTP